jgi:hypothetical protein
MLWLAVMLPLALYHLISFQLALRREDHDKDDETW